MEEKLLSNVKKYYEDIRKRSGHSPFGSILTNELSTLIKFASTSINPLRFLLSCGICLFSSSICAIQVNELSKVLCSSRSRINNCLKKENFVLITTPLPHEKSALETTLKENGFQKGFDIRTWAFRKIDNKSKLCYDLKSNDKCILQIGQAPFLYDHRDQLKDLPLFESQAIQPQSVQQTNDRLLSYQKDVFTWTFTDDPIFPY